MRRRSIPWRMAGVCSTLIALLGCQPPSYDATPESGRDDAPASDTSKPGVSDPNGVSDTGDESSIRVDVGDGVNVEVGEQVGVDVDKEGVDVDVDTSAKDQQGGPGQDGGTPPDSE